MILPRQDYTIVEDSWDVVGLRGTGSKDVIVKDAFIPDYRAVTSTEVIDGAPRAGRDDRPLYLMPWSTMFPLGITSAVIGIAEGALAAHMAYQRERVATRHEDQGRSLRAVRDRRSGRRDQGRPQGAARQRLPIFDMSPRARRSRSTSGPPPAYPGACPVRCRARHGRDRRPFRRQRPADGQPDPTVLARRPHGPGARDPCARPGVPRVRADPLDIVPPARCWR